MTKVVHLTSAHPPTDVRIFVKECGSLVNAGYEVVLVVPDGKNRVEDGMRVNAIPKSAGRLGRMTKTARTVYRAAVDEEADVYHFHDPELIPTGLLLRSKGKRVIYDIHEDLPRQILSKHYLPTRLRGLVSAVIEKAEDLAAKRFSVIVAATPHIAERFRRFNPRTVAVQNFPLLDELYIGGSRISWKERSRAVAYVGVMTAERGLREMVEAFGRLPEDYLAELRLAGRYTPLSLRDEVKALPGWGRVRELGFLGRRGVRATLSEIRAGLVLFYPEPNHLNAYPNKMFEYMAAGVPVIASDFPLWREIVEGAGCGLLVDPLNPKAIAAAVRYILDDPEEAEEMGQRGRRAVEERYNWESEKDKLLGVYEEVLAKDG